MVLLVLFIFSKSFCKIYDVIINKYVSAPKLKAVYKMLWGKTKINQVTSLPLRDYGGVSFKLSFYLKGHVQKEYVD